MDGPSLRLFDVEDFFPRRSRARRLVNSRSIRFSWQTNRDIDGAHRYETREEEFAGDSKRFMPLDAPGKWWVKRYPFRYLVPRYYELLLKLGCIARIPRGIFIANPFASFALYRATRDSADEIEVFTGKRIET